MRHRGGGGRRHCYLVTEHGVYVDMHKVEVILRVGRGGVESETEGGGGVKQRGKGAGE